MKHLKAEVIGYPRGTGYMLGPVFRGQMDEGPSYQRQGMSQELASPIMPWTYPVQMLWTTLVPNAVLYV